MVGLGWLLLSYWAADKTVPRRLISVVTAILVMFVLCITFMDRINPWLEETRRISRDSFKGLYIAMTAGLFSGIAISPLIAKVDWLFWMFQIILFLAWVILPALPSHR